MNNENTATNKKPGTNNNFRFVYNYIQANHYITRCGVMPVKIDKHHTTHNIFFVFNRDESTDNAFQSWMDNKYATKPIDTRG